MNQRLFDQFERRAPSWWPVILLSAFGLFATGIAVQAVARLNADAIDAASETLYRESRASAIRHPYLVQVSPVEDAERPPWLSELANVLPGSEYLGSVELQPRYPDGIPTEIAGIGFLSQVRHCWLDQDRTTLLVSHVEPSDEGGTPKTGGDPETGLRFQDLFAFSRSADDPTRYFSTLGAANDIPIFADEIAVGAGNAPQPCSTLIDEHHRFIENESLAQIDPETFLSAVQAYYDARAFAYANRGGFTYVERLKQVSAILGGDDHQAVLLVASTMLLGGRNGASKAFDRYAIEQYRQSTNPDSGDETPFTFVIHPASSSVRLQSIANVNDWDATLRAHGNSIDAFFDLPPDLEQRITPANQMQRTRAEALEKLRMHFQSHPDFHQVHQMESPFPATLYELRIDTP